MSQTRKARRAAARAASKATSTESAITDGSNVISIDKLKRALADSIMPRQPERGMRTPQPTINQSRAGSSANYGELSFDRLISIIRNAEEGFTQDWVDLTRRMLKTDAHLKSVWETRICPIASARWDIEPGDARDEVMQQHALRLADACREALTAIPDLAHVKLTLLEGIGIDFGVGEILWSRGSLLGIPATIPAAIAPVHPRRFAFDLYYRLGLWDNGRAVLELQAAGHDVEQGYGRGVALLPAGKYIVHQPATIHDWPTSRGLFFSITRPWWVKQWVTKYWLQGAEVGANPRTIATVAQEAPGDNLVSDLQANIDAFSSDGSIILRNGTTLEQREGVAEGSARVWHELYDMCDVAMTKAVLGSTLNVEVGDTGGNRALGESQAATTIMPRQLIDAEQMWLTFQRDLFRWVRDFNSHLFPPDTPLPTGYSILAEESVTVDELAVRAQCVTNDELRSTRKLPEWGGARGAEIATLDDASHPAIGATPAVGGEATVQDTALNGAQVTSLQGIVTAVAAGQLPISAAKVMIKKAFPTFNDAELAQMFGDVQSAPIAPPAQGVAEPARPFSNRLPWEQARIASTERMAT